MRQHYSNKTGYKGVNKVSLKSGETRYKAYIYVKGEQIYLGMRDSAENAAELYEKARRHFSLDVFEAIEAPAHKYFQQ